MLRRAHPIEISTYLGLGLLEPLVGGVPLVVCWLDRHVDSPGGDVVVIVCSN